MIRKEVEEAIKLNYKGKSCTTKYAAGREVQITTNGCDAQQSANIR